MGIGDEAYLRRRRELEHAEYAVCPQCGPVDGPRPHVYLLRAECCAAHSVAMFQCARCDHRWSEPLATGGRKLASVKVDALGPFRKTTSKGGS